MIGMESETGSEEISESIHSGVVYRGNAGGEQDHCERRCAQRSAALQTLDDLTAMMLAHTLDTVQGKTALLTGLIAELTQVINAIQVAPPYAQAVETVVAIVDKARVRLTAEKKNLLPSDA